MRILQEEYDRLPARFVADQVNRQLKECNRLIITAPPGAGKSTLLPLTMLQGLQPEGKILMLEPRRLAARQIALRMASLLGEEVGRTVGYRIRFDNRISPDTRIEVLTEGILTRMLTDDPTLEGVSLVLFDEFHERSLNSDLALALASEAQSLLRPDLRLVLMSATIDTELLRKRFQAPVVESQGRLYPVSIEYRPRPINDTRCDSIATDMARAIMEAWHHEEGDILAFLPGEAEIVRCAGLLGDDLPDTDVRPLYAQLTPQLQQQAIQPSVPGRRKIVLSTNIAETSLTIQGIRVVVDSGLQRRMVFDGRTGMSHLQTVPVSLDMARQRTGRAGRLQEGVCYRLWSQAAEHLLQENRPPEILEADLSPLMLDVAAWGESHPDRLSWITPPAAAGLRQAQDLLHLLGAIQTDGRITPMGRKMALMACHPRIARLLLSVQKEEEKALATDIAALLEERDPLQKGEDGTPADTDITLRVTLMREARRQRRSDRLQHLLLIAGEYRSMLKAKEDNTPPDSTLAGLLLARAYPERIARATDRLGNYRTADGLNVRLSGTDSLAGHPWLSVARMNTSSGSIFLAAALHEDLLTEFCTSVDRLSWDNKQGTLLQQTEQRIGLLTVNTKPLQASREQQTKTLCQAAMKYGESMLDFSCDAVIQLQRRVVQVALWHPELGLPDLGTGTVLERAADWLPLWLQDNGHLRTTTAELKKVPLAEALLSLLNYDQQQALDRLAPTHITVPTGSRIRLDYRSGAQAPVLSVRLQECFGLTDTPCVNDGRQPVLMELLSPGFKPVQLTSDLRSFWSDAYFEVRKDLRRRYPRHAWPDNPLETRPSRR